MESPVDKYLRTHSEPQTEALEWLEHAKSRCQREGDYAIIAA